MRLVDDLKLWSDFLLLRIKRFKNEGKEEWRLVEKYFEYSNEQMQYDTFIPPPDKYKNWSEARKYPSLKGRFSVYIQNIFSILKYNEEKKINIKVIDISTPPLHVFMKNYENKTFTKCLVSKTKYQKSDNLNLLINLNESSIT